MTVAFVKRKIDEFGKIQSAFGALKVEIGRPWHFNESKEEYVPFGKEHGLYLFTKPNLPDWEIEAEENDNPVWYVGKSAGDIGGRVWKHVGLIFDPETKLVCNPRFKFHRWSNVLSVPEDTRKSVADGNVVVYTVAVRSESMSPLLSELLEKYVLVHYALENGGLPELNLQF